jgi:hypothetical protein
VGCGAAFVDGLLAVRHTGTVYSAAMGMP